MSVIGSRFEDSVRRAVLAEAHRALSDLSNRSITSWTAVARDVVRQLSTIEILSSFIDLKDAVTLSAGLGELLSRSSPSERRSIESLEDLTVSVLRRISELSQPGAVRNRPLYRASQSALTTSLESEVSRKLGQRKISTAIRPLPVGTAGVAESSLQRCLEGVDTTATELSLSIIDLYRADEFLTELVTVLGSFHERGDLLRAGILKPLSRRRTGSEEVQGLEMVYYVITEAHTGERLGEQTFSNGSSFLELIRFPSPKEGGESPTLTLDKINAALVGGMRSSGVGETGIGQAEQDIEALIEDGQKAPSDEEQGRKKLVPTHRNVPIGLKLITIISLVILASLTAMIVLASVFFRDDVTVKIEENNHTVSTVTAESVGDQFDAIVRTAQLFLTMQADLPASSSDSVTTVFFEQNADFIYMGVGGAEAYFNDSYLASQSLSRDSIARILAGQKQAISAADSGQSSVQNLAKELGVPAMGIFLPYRNGARNTHLVIICSLDRLLRSVQSTGVTVTFIVNGQGRLIAHPDLALVSADIDYSSLPIVNAMLKSPLDNGERQYSDPTGTMFLGSFKKVAFAGLGVISAAPVSKAFAAVQRIQRRNLYLMVIVLSIAILIVYFFSKTLTRPVRRLVEASHEIERGHFLLDLKPTTRDEIARLTESFVRMGQGLNERERMKEALGRFVNRSVAERVLSGKLTLGGERRHATVFLSDIRDFTAMSEDLQPEQVVEILNEYMSLMVECVNQTGGVVDKFIGDGIMAVWGVPVSQGNDAEAAINSALRMRDALEDFNRGRGDKGRPVIHIGCAINSGTVVAGQIGSTERMEYTVIGNPVNLASRIEALNKVFGTDILISEDTYALVEDIFAVEPQLKIRVKGRTEAQQVYAVLGRLDDPSRPNSLIELQQRIGVDTSKLSGTMDGYEEVKYEVLED